MSPEPSRAPRADPRPAPAFPVVSGERADDRLTVGGVEIARGTVRHVQIPLSEVAIRVPVPVHVTVVRGNRPGPRLFLTAGVHGDELNGVEIVRAVSYRFEPARLAGDLICVPIVNVPGFLNHSRYLPDGTDLNRFFPGALHGKPAARFAHRLMEEIVRRCDGGIDFHTAARGRANIPHVRADMDRPAARAIAKAFGTTVVVHKLGHRRSLRRAATEAGVPTIVIEAGETGKLQTNVRERGMRGVENVLIALGMLAGERREPAFQVIVRDSVWVRAQQGGLCELTVGPGDLVYEGSELGTNTNPFGPESHPIVSPVTGLVIGVSLDPICEPGNPLCHIVRLKKTLPTVERHLQRGAQG